MENIIYKNNKLYTLNMILHLAWFTNWLRSHCNKIYRESCSGDNGYTISELLAPSCNEETQTFYFASELLEILKEIAWRKIFSFLVVWIICHDVISRLEINLFYLWFKYIIVYCKLLIRCMCININLNWKNQSRLDIVTESML